MSDHSTLRAGSSGAEGTSNGRMLARNASSATRAERFAERVAAKVAIASTVVPAAVASDATVCQSATTGRATRLRGGAGLEVHEVGRALLEAPGVEGTRRHVVTGDLGAQHTHRALFLRPDGVRVEVVPGHRVLVGDLVHLRVGHAELLAHAVELLGRVRPRRVGVRIVHLPADVVDTDVVA